MNRILNNQWILIPLLLINSLLLIYIGTANAQEDGGETKSVGKTFIPLILSASQPEMAHLVDKEPQQPTPALDSKLTAAQPTKIVQVRKTYMLTGQPVAQRSYERPANSSRDHNNGTGKQLHFIYTDHLGSANTMVDENGNQSNTRFLPFGEIRDGESFDNGLGSITERGFTGHRENREIGLTYMNARYYVPGVGRFASADTIVPDPMNPQQYNRYAYVLNNPLLHIDPTGHSCETINDPVQLSQCGEAKFDWENPAQSVLYLSFPYQNSQELSGAMQVLYYGSNQTEINNALTTIADVTGISFSEAESQYATYQAYLSFAKLNGYKHTDLIHRTDHWASSSQLLFGKVVGDELGLDPAFAALLEPTGGLAGRGEQDADLLEWGLEPDTNLEWKYHTVAHDAGGYLKNYLNIGPGYTYRSNSATWGQGMAELGSRVPLRGQRYVNYWKKQTPLSVSY